MEWEDRWKLDDGTRIVMGKAGCVVIFILAVANVIIGAMVR